ncbi:hypothetical protein IFO70_35070 [Phormidium tenue FACHB-886]|nr:hypothetical protein [Phormidium tenue FACHB-886]
MAAFIVFASIIVSIGLAGSIVIGRPSWLLLRNELKQHSDSQRFAVAAYCSLSAVATLLLTALWSVSVMLNLAHPSAGVPPDELMVWLKILLGFGLAPGLSMFSAGLTSLCWRRN